MNALFVELPEFSRHREKFLDDDAFRTLQGMMLKMPEAGVVLEGTGGLRKLRYADPHRSRGKRSGLRVIYYWSVSYTHLGRRDGGRACACPGCVHAG